MKPSILFVLALAVAAGAAAQSRSPRQRDGGEGGGAAAVPRTAPAPSPAPSPSPSPAPTASPAPAAEPRRAPGTATTASGSGDGASGATAAQPRQGRPTTGNAVPRGSVPAPQRSGGTAVVFGPSGYYGGFWPWGFGGLGFGGYYSGAFDPYYGGYPAGDVSGPGTGSMRLKIKPREAQVFVDGFYAGIVDDFDGVFQRLHLDPGPHHIEVRADGYEPLNLDVQVRPDQTTKYEGDLRKIQ